jgi:uncharacterized membrane protein
VTKTRLEAFSDGVIAIILTIMVLELKVPKEPTVSALGHLWPVYFAYALSFANVFLMWLSHHEILESVRSASYYLLFVNGILLFTMSLVPFATAWAGESHWAEPVPAALYGVVMLSASLAFIWFRVLTGRHSRDAGVLARQKREAGITLLVAAIFLVGVFTSFHEPRMAMLLYAGVPIGRLAYRMLQGNWRP